MNECRNPLSLGESTKYPNKLRRRYSFILPIFILNISILVLFSSCSQTRHLPEGEYLLDKSKLELDSKELDMDELEPLVRQKPNKQVLGMKFHLFLYNLASPGKDKGISGWLKNIGEEPIVWNPVLTDRSTNQLERYVQTKGYYDGRVTDSIKQKRDRVYIKYNIELNEPHRIRTIAYVFEDQKIKPFVLSDTANRLIREGKRFDKETLDEERERIELFLRNQGFYRFSKEFIFYKATEIPENKLVDIEIRVKENITGIPDPETKVRHHQRYKIKDTYIYPNYIKFSAGEGEFRLDTVNREGNTIVYTEKRTIRPDPVVLPNRCVPGNTYRLNDVKKTYSNYSSLGLFRLINIRFNELNTGLIDTSDYLFLDCFVELTPRKLQSYQTEIVGTNSAGDLGARVNFTYNNYNLFRGAENFRVQFTGAVEDMRKQLQQSTLAPMREGGVETSLTLPKFLVPFPARRFTMKYNPRTSIHTSFNYQDRPDYVRTIAGTSLSYLWKVNRFSKHHLFPLDFNYVRVPGEIDQDFWNEIRNSSYRTSFEDHTILSTRYTFEYTTQVLEKKTDFIYLRSNLESAGNILYTLSKVSPFISDSIFMRVPYFRYLKADIEFQVHNQITPGNKIVYRLFGGLGRPLGYHQALPYEKLYFSGGPNGIRAWPSLGLGPGSSVDTEGSSYYQKKGDIKLEANLEYRFKLFWVLEGALFIDAGNTWSFSEKEELTGANFDWERFYNEIAVGTGIGLRFDFSFLILRTDVGFKLRDPELQPGNRWIDTGNEPYALHQRFNYHFGIGYPF